MKLKPILSLLLLTGSALSTILFIQQSLKDGDDLTGLQISIPVEKKQKLVEKNITRPTSQHTQQHKVESKTSDLSRTLVRYKKKFAKDGCACCPNVVEEEALKAARKGNFQESIRKAGPVLATSLVEKINESDYAPYIPKENDSPTIVHVSIHVFQNDDGSNNFQDNPTDRQALINMINNVNAKYRNMAPSSDLIPWLNKAAFTSHVTNSKVQFSLGPNGKERIHFYQKTSYNSGVYAAGDENIWVNYIKSQNKWAINDVPIFLTQKVYGNAAGKVNTFPTESPSQYNRQQTITGFGYHNGYVPGSGWIDYKNLHHEFAHILNLHHNYGSTCSTTFGTDRYLYDVYGLNAGGTAPGWCPVNGSEGDPWAHPFDKSTNNVMQGKQWHASPWMSRLQAGKVHYSLNFTSLKKYAIRRLTTNDYGSAVPTKSKQVSNDRDLYRAWNIPTAKGEWSIHRLFWNNYHWAIEFIELPEEIHVDSLTASTDNELVYAVTKTGKLLCIRRGIHNGYPSTVNHVALGSSSNLVDKTSLILAPLIEGLYAYVPSNDVMMRVQYNTLGSWTYSSILAPSGKSFIPGSFVRGPDQGVYGLYSNSPTSTIGDIGRIVAGTFSDVGIHNDYSKGSLVTLIKNIGFGGWQVPVVAAERASTPLHDIYVASIFTPTTWTLSSPYFESILTSGALPVKDYSYTQDGTAALAVSQGGSIVHFYNNSYLSNDYAQINYSYNSIDSLVKTNGNRLFTLTTSGQLNYYVRNNSFDTSIWPFSNPQDPYIFTDLVHTWGAAIEQGTLIKTAALNNIAALDINGETIITWESSGPTYAIINEEITYIP